jgi:hypothetical protein
MAGSQRDGSGPGVWEMGEGQSRWELGNFVGIGKKGRGG